MNFDQELTAVKQEMELAITHLKEELAMLAAGRASVGMVDTIQVDSYGTNMPLKGVASITIPESNQLVIQPWDKSLLSNIEKAIKDSELNMNPMNDGNVVRIIIPKPTEEKRKELVKMAQNKAEDARIALRNARQKLHGSVKEAKESSEITEDDFYNYNEQLDKVINDFNNTIDEILKSKEEELMSV